MRLIGSRPARTVSPRFVALVASRFPLPAFDMTSSAPELDRLRFPIGRFSYRPDASADDRARMIDVIARFGVELRAAAGALDDAGLDTPYRPGGWTKRQVVHHCADSHMNAYIRFMLGITEDEPTVKPYDEAAWAETPYARSAPVEASLRIVEGLHERWAAMMRDLDDAQWQRAVTHPERGRITLEFLLQLYAWHCPHHLGHMKA